MENLRPLFPDLPECGVLPHGPAIIAGPCSAESRGQTLATAEALARGGVRVFRAGIWKPRTRPGSFEGVGDEALPWLKEVRETTGMKVLTEVATPEHVASAVSAGLDGVWIGARTTTNPFAVQDIADALAALPEMERDRLAVLVKNPVNPDLELWIGALQRLYRAGVRRLGAIHRGFSYYAPGPSDYRNAPYWRIPIELHRRFPSLPLFFDPSHTAGVRRYVGPLSAQALEMCFDGLIVEVHCNPDAALSDAAQQLTPDDFLKMAGELRKSAEAPAEASLSILRDEIDALDKELLEVLSRRMDVSRRIGELKREQGLAVVQPSRYARLIDERTARAEALGLPAEFVRGIFSAIHEESVRRQLPEK